jgi:hypothetical protein
MGLMERFTGQPEADERFGHLVANPSIKRPLSYQLLFTTPLDLDEEAVTRAIRFYHPSLSRAVAEFLPVNLQNSQGEEANSLIGLAGWDRHVIKLVGFNSPIPTSVFDTCVQPAHFGMPLKDEARRHQSHLLLYYAGYENDPLEQYVALTVIASALARFDGILLLNESARTAFPAAALLADDPDHDALQMLRSMPIPLLYGGFVKVEIEDEPGVWMRTFGNALLKLPDLAFKAEGHHQGSDTFDLFANVLSYLRESGKSLAPGHTMQIGNDTYLRARIPTEAEWYLQSDGQMLVVEKIGATEVNQPPAQ